MVTGTFSRSVAPCVGSIRLRHLVHCKRGIRIWSGSGRHMGLGPSGISDCVARRLGTGCRLRRSSGPDLRRRFLFRTRVTPQHHIAAARLFHIKINLHQLHLIRGWRRGHLTGETAEEQEHQQQCSEHSSARSGYHSVFFFVNHNSFFNWDSPWPRPFYTDFCSVPSTRCSSRTPLPSGSPSPAPAHLCRHAG